MNSRDIDKILGFQNKSSLALSCILYPMEQAKIQIRLSEKPTFNIQRILAQVKQTYHIAGLSGCYTGFIPWFASSVTYRFAFSGANQAFSSNKMKYIYQDELTEYRRFRRFARHLGKGIVCRTVAVVASQPFYVISVRMVSELITEERKYTDLFTSLWTLLREEGLEGLFAGLFPRLLADLTIYTSVATVTYALHRSLTLEVGAREMVDFMVASVAGFYCCPLTVVSSRMAINNSGSLSHWPHFVNSYDCWNHLYSR